MVRATFIKLSNKTYSGHFIRCVIGKHPKEVEEKGKDALEVEEKAQETT
jgi:hypothetical protein